MTSGDSTTPTSELNEGEPRTLFDQHEGVDWLLAWVVSLAERGVEMGITVTTGGQLVSGTVIGGRTYFEGVAANIKSANYTGTGGSGLADVLADSLTNWKDIYPEKDAIAADHVPKPTFLHLKDANPVIVGNNINRGKGTFWRFSLSKVDAWSFGTVTYS